MSKYAAIIQVQPLGVKRSDAALMVGGETVLAELLERGLVKPRIARHKLTVFDVAELREGWEKLKRPDQSPDRSAGV